MLWHPRHRPPEGPRHTVEWYVAEGREPPPVGVGERMLIRCEGGPAYSRLERFPPLLEIEVEGGTYVLDDEGPIQHWRYRFVAGRS
jgi:hypothetical protein